MQNRNAIYKDLLAHNITEVQLTAFICKLTLKTENNIFLPLTELTEIDQPVYFNGFEYLTGLCFAVKFKQTVIVEALLKSGANPNVGNHLQKGWALFRALLDLDFNNFDPRILSLLLDAPDIDVYTMDQHGRSAFDYNYSHGDTTTILLLLESDSELATHSSEQKKNMAKTISGTMKPVDPSSSNQTIKTALTLLETTRKIYKSEDERKKFIEVVNDACSVTQATPLGSTVISYLFKPIPESLKFMQNQYKDKKIESEEVKAIKINNRSCSVL